VSEGRELRPFDFGGRKADSVSLGQQLIGSDRLPIDANQIVLGPGGLEPLCEQGLNGLPSATSM